MASPIYNCILELKFVEKKFENFTIARGEKLRGRRLRLSIKGILSFTDKKSRVYDTVRYPL